MALYSVTYTSAKAVEALALKRGMKPDLSNGGFWDFVSHAELTSEVARTTSFGDAVVKAKAIAPHDVCGEARIEEVVRVHWCGAPPTWEVVAFWDVGEGAADPKADAPDARNELDLSDGDEVLAA